MDKKSFNSKILLFGEYSVIKNSMALAIPYPHFSGSLTFDSDSKKTDNELQSFTTYLQHLKNQGTLDFPLDINTIEFDLSQGLIFKSSIPQGYGVGSSGALCAALYHKYCQDNVNDLNKIKNRLSVLESYFHGKSSGFDPLVSYLNRPILIKSNSENISVDIPHFKEGKSAIFILNTGRPRRTEPLVNLFLEKCKEPSFEKLCSTDLFDLTNSCISCFLEGDFEKLWRQFQKLSDFQYNNLLPMIPQIFQQTWKTGLSSDEYLFKLCGAGGGGFILGICKDFDLTSRLLKPYATKSIYRFSM